MLGMLGFLGLGLVIVILEGHFGQFEVDHTGLAVGQVVAFIVADVDDTQYRFAHGAGMR